MLPPGFLGKVNGGKSSALQPLGWGFALSISFAGIALWRQAPEWMLCIACGFAAIFVLSYIGAYFFFMLKQPEHLRSESYGLQMKALEKGAQGDSDLGFRDVSPKTRGKANIAGTAITASEGSDLDPVKVDKGKR